MSTSLEEEQLKLEQEEHPQNKNNISTPNIFQGSSINNSNMNISRTSQHLELELPWNMLGVEMLFLF